ncbi:MAG TPA: hypothetical protein PLV50_07120 [Smithella sp.]|nr:hypothetical protein [Smithella sp.]MDM7987390.1 hypothetical protein [Smithella sp.]HNY50569.1 hypothetical protein [Smithella sp.]HOG90291.1 hypothetical protein [Smithella sp.]HOU51945.1 hypothetical protein [Smithella sp.]
MKKIIILAMATFMMLVTISGCWPWWYGPGGHHGYGGHSGYDRSGHHDTYGGHGGHRGYNPGHR